MITEFTSKTFLFKTPSLRYVGQAPRIRLLLEACSCIALFKEFMDLLINLFSFPQISFGETGGHVLWTLLGFISQLYATPSVGPSDPHFPHL